MARVQVSWQREEKSPPDLLNAISEKLGNDAIALDDTVEQYGQ